MKKYKLLDHTADIGIEVWGKTKKELFENAVEAMFDLMVDLAGINNVNVKIVTLKVRMRKTFWLISCGKLFIYLMEKSGSLNSVSF